MVDDGTADSGSPLGHESAASQSGHDEQPRSGSVYFEWSQTVELSSSSGEYGPASSSSCVVRMMDEESQPRPLSSKVASGCDAEAGGV